MSRAASILLLLVIAPLALADSAVQQAQEQLKEQGFYYGQITGEKNADTTAAIRRFQIRNGLQVTGELNDETLRALNANPSARVETATPAPQRGEAREETGEIDEPANERPPSAPVAPPAGRLPPPDPYRPATPTARSDVFSATPYATAPLPLQRQVLTSVQTSLRRRGLYHGAIDGVYGPELEYALRSYQGRLGLLATGQLDMDTLASLELLPGQRAPHLPRRRAFAEPPVRGEWIH